MGDTDHPQHWYGLGNQYYNQAQYEKAVNCYAHAIKICPTFKEAYNNMGLGLFQTRHYEQALQCFKTLISLAPQYADAYANMGIVLEHQDRPDQAKKCYQKALDINPESFQANHNLGMIFEQELELDQALKYYFKALDINPDNSSLHINICSTFHQPMRSLTKVLATLKKALITTRNVCRPKVNTFSPCQSYMAPLTKLSTIEGDLKKAWNKSFPPHIWTRMLVCGRP